MKMGWKLSIFASLSYRCNLENQKNHNKVKQKVPGTSLAHSFSCQMLGLVATSLHTFVALLISLVVLFNIALDCFTCVNYAFAHTLMHWMAKLYFSFMILAFDDLLHKFFTYLLGELLGPRWTFLALFQGEQFLCPNSHGDYTASAPSVVTLVLQPTGLCLQSEYMYVPLSGSINFLGTVFKWSGMGSNKYSNTTKNCTLSYKGYNGAIIQC